MAKPFITRKARWKGFSTSWCRNGGTKGGGVPPPPGIETEMNDGCGGPVLIEMGTNRSPTSWCQNGDGRGMWRASLYLLVLTWGGLWRGSPPGVETGVNEGCGGFLPSPGVETGTNEGCGGFSPPSGIETGMNEGCGGFSPPSGIETGMNEGCGGFLPSPGVETGRTRGAGGSPHLLASKRG
jgi:hypothetical protein